MFPFQILVLGCLLTLSCLIPISAENRVSQTTCTFDDVEQREIVSLLNIKYCPGMGYLNQTALKGFIQLWSLRIINVPIKIIDKNAFDDLPLLNEMEIIKLGMNKISDIRIYQLVHLRSLNISENKISEINATDLSNSNLEILCLNNNDVEVINELAFSKLSKLVELDLSNNKLLRLDGKIFKNNVELRVIYLHNNRLKFLSNKLFSTLTKLEYLTLKSNYLSSISNNIFKNNVLLKSLYLSENCISFVDNRAFNNLKNTSFLDLSTNAISNLSDTVFDNSSIELLFLNHNELDTLPVNIFAPLKTLEYILLHNNNFTEIDSKLFRNNKKLKNINLTFNKIQKIDIHSICTYSNAYLHLKNNNISNIDNDQPSSKKEYCSGKDISFNNISRIYKNTFKLNTEIKLLDLSDNNINIIHAKSLDFNTNLKMCDLSKNNISELDGQLFSKLHKLNSLRLNHNRLQFLNSSMFLNNTELVYLRLMNNCFTDIEEQIFHPLTKLKILYISYNRIQSLHENTFTKNYALLELYLNNNNISNLPPNIFGNLTELSTLFAENNKITKLNGKLFLHTTQLTYINLSNNSITYLPQNLFRKLVNLTELFLNNNQITFITVKTFKDQQNLKKLDLSYNRIDFVSQYYFKTMKKLEIIRLANNEISRIDFETFRLNTNLRILDLDNNYITLIFRECFPLGAFYLKVLIWGNDLNTDDVRSNGIDINLLQSVNKHNNKLKKLLIRMLDIVVFANKNFIKRLTCDNELTLAVLNLEFNKMNSTDCFPRMIKLQHLNLAHNEYSSLSFEMFATMTKLKTLDISHNNLMSIDVGIFRNQIHLLEFHNTANQLTFSWSFFKIPRVFPKLTRISLTDNQIYCPLLPSILDYYEQNGINVTDLNRDATYERFRVHNITCYNNTHMYKFFMPFVNVLILAIVTAIIAFHISAQN